MSADAYEIPRADIPVPERGTYIPRWYTPHGDPSRQVLDENDGDLGFTVGQVLPERRWAIAEDGHLLPQHQFEQRFKQWCERVLAPNGAIIEIKRFNKYFNVDLETVPGVDEFVDAKPDASMPSTKPEHIRYVAINYDPMDAENGRRKIRPIYSHTGERIGKEEAAEAPPVGFDAVAPKPKKAKADEPMETMPCGKEQKAKFRANHVRFCKRCKEIALTETQAAADSEATAAA